MNPLIEETAKELGVDVDKLERAARNMANGKPTKEDKLLLDSISPEQKRPCGDCDFCCKAPAIEETSLDRDTKEDKNFQLKPACQACQFAKGKGCSIYEDRPSVCKSYQCLWSSGVIPAKHFPMKRGVAWCSQAAEDEHGEIHPLFVGHALDVEKCLKDPHTIGLIASFLKGGEVIGVTIRDDKQAIHFQPSGRGMRGKINQSDPLKSEILVETSTEFNFRFM